MNFIELQTNRNTIIRGVFIRSSNCNSKTVVVCIPGFECVATTAPKFIRFTNELLSLPSNSIAGVVRYDPTGIGLSDGEYHRTTIDTLVDDLTTIMNYLLVNYEKFSFITHSLGICVLIEYLKLNKQKIEINKMILLAPALNQCELHRYWFMQQKQSNLTWEIFKNNFQESNFVEYLNNHSSDQLKPCRAYEITYEFVRICSTKDYSFALADYQNQILHIHANADPVVPIESVKDRFIHNRIFSSTDHDLEEPNILFEWTKQASKFIYETF